MQRRIIRLMITATGVIIALPVAGTACASDAIDPLENGIEGDVSTTADSDWTIEDGVLMPERGEERAYVVTKARYADVEITLEFNPEAGTNSGVFARCQDPEVISPMGCYEFNIWDSNPRPESRTGAIVTLSPPLMTVKTEDKWNTMRIVLDGPRLRVWVNDTLTSDIEDGELASGHIAFQYGGDNGMVAFRNIRIRSLP